MTRTLFEIYWEKRKKGENTMTDEKQKGLNELFSEYEERKQKESEKEKIRQSEEKALRNKAIGLITKTIIPVMEEFKKKCEEKGHLAKIEDRVVSVEFSFTPKKQELLSYVSPSKIKYSHSDKGKITISRNIAGRGASSLYNLMADEIEVEEVTEQSIKVTLGSFIKNVLKAN